MAGGNRARKEGSVDRRNLVPQNLEAVHINARPSNQISLPEAFCLSLALVSAMVLFEPSRLTPATHALHAPGGQKVLVKSCSQSARCENPPRWTSSIPFIGAVGLAVHASRSRVSRSRCFVCAQVQDQGGLPLVEVVKVNDEVGFGLVVPRGASAGTILIEEDPLYRRAEGESMADSVAAFKQMTQMERNKLLRMAASPGLPEKEVGYTGDDLTFVRVLRTNSVAIVGEDRGGAVYELSCRANHSCKPNAALCVQTSGTMHLKALRDILPGEDVQVSYIGEGDLLRPTEHRQKQLSHWGFSCQCERCTGVEDTRGLQCPACGAGTMKYEKSEISGHRWGPCSCCQAVLPEETLSGTEKQWEEHVSSLRPSENLTPQIALAMYDGLLSSLKEDSSAPAPDGHWISAKLGRLAAEELIKQGRSKDAKEAVRPLRRYVRSTLGAAATRVTAFATYIEAAAAALEGKSDEAAELCRAALQEASLLPRNGDQLSDKIRRVEALCKQRELTLS